MTELSGLNVGMAPFLKLSPGVGVAINTQHLKLYYADQVNFRSCCERVRILPLPPDIKYGYCGTISTGHQPWGDRRAFIRQAFVRDVTYGYAGQHAGRKAPKYGQLSTGRDSTSADWIERVFPAFVM